MSKHTRGPWWPQGFLFVDRTLNYWEVRASSSDSPEPTIVCRVKSEADAALIAAAPELLEALKGLHRFMHDNVGFEKCARLDELACIAITKAEGN